jgi:DNA-binding CsgD family transcriptional regulator
MNMTTKEIAAITFQTPNSIDVGKFRLRKKLGVENDEEFMRFLMSL